MIDQYKAEKYFIDLYFPEHKLGIEIDENNHLDRSNLKEQKREETIKHLAISLIRINPDKKVLTYSMKYLKYKVLFMNLL